MPPFPALPITPGNPAHMDWLDSIQGNLVKGHGREFTRLLVFKFPKPGKENARLLPHFPGRKLWRMRVSPTEVALQPLTAVPALPAP